MLGMRNAVSQVRSGVNAQIAAAVYRSWNAKAAEAAMVRLHARRMSGLKVEQTAINY